MYSFFKKYRRKNRTKTEKIFLYFLSSIFCFNMTDCIPCFLLYKEFKSGPLFERGLLQNQSNSRLFGYSILSKLVISSCRMHEPKLWFRILLCRDRSCDFVAVSARRNLRFCHVECGLFWIKPVILSYRMQAFWGMKPVIPLFDCHGKCKEKVGWDLWFRNFCAHSFLSNHTCSFKSNFCPHRSCKQEERWNNWTDEEGGWGEKLNRRVG